MGEKIDLDIVYKAENTIVIVLTSLRTYLLVKIDHNHFIVVQTLDSYPTF
jgi:hypothetical protein